MKNFLPSFPISKLGSKKLRILSLAVILILSSILFLLAGPKTLDLVENSAQSKNLEAEKSNSPGIVLAQTNEKKLELISANIPQPALSAVAVIAYDVDTDKIIYQKDAHARLAPASTTKIMTAIVASEHFENGDLLTVPQEAVVSGSKMGLIVGETLTFRSLLYGMMLNSGNDAAFTIAMNYPGGYDGFVLQMNLKTSELGLKDTHFDNPAGFDSPTHYSSAFDLLQIGKEAIKNVRLGRVFSTKETSVTSIDKTQLHTLKNLNKLLGEDGILGIKTGTTEMAGESFVGLVERNGRTILSVMLNSNDRFGETKTLLDWIFDNFTWKFN